MEIPGDVREAQLRLDRQLGHSAVPMATGGHGRVYRVGAEEVYVLFQSHRTEPVVYVEVQGVHDLLGQCCVRPETDRASVGSLAYARLAAAIMRAAGAKERLTRAPDRSDACLACRLLECAALDVRARLPAVLDGDSGSRAALAAAVDEARQALQVLWSVAEDDG